MRCFVANHNTPGRIFTPVLIYVCYKGRSEPMPLVLTGRPLAGTGSDAPTPPMGKDVLFGNTWAALNTT